MPRPEQRAVKPGMGVSHRKNDCVDSVTSIFSEISQIIFIRTLKVREIGADGAGDPA